MLPPPKSRLPTVIAASFALVVITTFIDVAVWQVTGQRQFMRQELHHQQAEVRRLKAELAALTEQRDLRRERAEVRECILADGRTLRTTVGDAR